jgi:phosphomannomutase/phosphoglucomutase
VAPANPSIFREYDIRGVAERDFDAGFAHALGRGYAAYLAERSITGRIGVGRDCRLTSDAYAAAVRRGLLESGCDVVDLGVCPTPVTYFALFDLELAGAIQVTGSHNPASDNGFKVCVGRTTIYGAEIQALRRLIEAGRAPDGRGRVEGLDIVARYQAEIIRRLPVLARHIHAVVAPGNAIAGRLASSAPWPSTAPLHADGRQPPLTRPSKPTCAI